MVTGFTPDFQNIVNKYQKHKEQSYQMLELVGSDYTFQNYGSDIHNKLYGTIVNCGTQLFFTKTFESNQDVYHLTGANFCRCRICPMCQFRRSEKLFIQMFQVVKSLENQYRFIHLVLTVPNVETGSELVDSIKNLYAGFNRFYNYADIKKAYKGALRCLEISYNYDNDTFHPHLHCLIAVKPSYFTDSRIYLNTEKIQTLWTKAMKSDTPLQIHHRACKKGDYVGVAEVCKYCVKPLELEEKNEIQNIRILLTLYHTLKGSRFLQKYGIIKEKFNELFDGSEEEYIDDLRNGEHRRMYLKWDDRNMFYRKGEDL